MLENCYTNDILYLYCADLGVSTHIPIFGTAVPPVTPSFWKSAHRRFLVVWALYICVGGRLIWPGTPCPSILS